MQLCSRVEELILTFLMIKIYHNIALPSQQSRTNKEYVTQNILKNHYLFIFPTFTKKENEVIMQHVLNKEKENLPGYTLHEKPHRCYIIASSGPS